MSSGRVAVPPPDPASDDLFYSLATDEDAKAALTGLSSRTAKRRSLISQPDNLTSSPHGDETTRTTKSTRGLTQAPSSYQRPPYERESSRFTYQQAPPSSGRVARAISQSANGSVDSSALASFEQRRTSGEYFRGANLATPRSASRQRDAPYSTGQPTLDLPLSRRGSSRDKPAFDTQSTSQADDTSMDNESTAAPSTVWDELEMVKDRLRKLEHSGSRPRSRAAAQQLYDLSDRPRTGTTQTTAQTTVSSARSGAGELLSPGLPKPSIVQDLHPNLHFALEKTREVLDPSVYRTLENSAVDALSLAALARVDSTEAQSQAASTIDSFAYSQKRVMRKADDLCRSLTELCIALCERPSSAATSPIDIKRSFRPSSRDRLNGNNGGYSNSPLGALDDRRRLTERVDRLANNYSTRLGERADAARQNGAKSSMSAYPSRGSGRASSTNAHGYHQYTVPDDQLDGNGEGQLDPDADLRPPSRAMTDLPAFGRAENGNNLPRLAQYTQRPHHQQHSSRDLIMSQDYTNRHPLPDNISPSVRQALSNSSVLPSAQTNLLNGSASSRVVRVQDSPSGRGRNRSTSAAVPGGSRNGYFDENDMSNEDNEETITLATPRAAANANRSHRSSTVGNTPQAQPRAARKDTSNEQHDSHERMNVQRAQRRTIAGASQLGLPSPIRGSAAVNSSRGGMQSVPTTPTTVLGAAEASSEDAPVDAATEAAVVAAQAAGTSAKEHKMLTKEKEKEKERGERRSSNIFKAKFGSLTGRRSSKSATPSGGHSSAGGSGASAARRRSSEVPG